MKQRLAILTVAVIVVLAVPAALMRPTPAAAGKFRTVTVTKVHAVEVDCLATDAGGYCHPVLWFPVQVAKTLSVVFTASPAHCGSILVRMGFNNGFSGPNYVVQPGGVAGGPYSGVPPGLHVVGVLAKASGDPGCGAGDLLAYEGTLTVKTTKRVRR